MRRNKVQSVINLIFVEDWSTEYWNEIRLSLCCYFSRYSFTFYHQQFL